MAETPTLTDRSVERQRMIAAQVARRGVTDARVLEAMRQVPREAFVHEGMEEFAYEDSPLPICGRTDDLAALYRRLDDRSCPDQTQ